VAQLFFNREFRRFRKFVRLNRAEQLILVRALFWLAYVRFLLRVMPLSRLQQRIARMTRNGTGPVSRPSGTLELIPWAVGTAGKYVPGANCLAQALAAQVLYARRGCVTVLRIGVSIEEAGIRSAHAWIEREGRPVVSHWGSISKYVPIDMTDVKGAEREWRLFC
jgi:hypothetical protein